MKNILFFFFLVVALAACRKPQPEAEPQTATYQGPDIKDHALLTQADIMVLYYAGYSKGQACILSGENLDNRWTLDSLSFVAKIQPLLRK